MTLRATSSRLKRTAAEDRSTMPGKRGVTPKPEEFVEIDGKKFPNPETAEGRKRLIRNIADSSISLKTRALLIEKFVNKALASEDRQDFKEQLEQLVDNVAKLKTQDVPQLADKLVDAFNIYQTVRKHQSEGKPSGSQSLASYKRRHGLV